MKHYVLAAMGGSLPFVVQYLAEVNSRGAMMTPDTFAVFLAVAFACLALLAHFITSKSSELAAILGGIGAPSLFFALATGNSIGKAAEDSASDIAKKAPPQTSNYLSLVPAALACCGGGEVIVGADVGVKGTGVRTGVDLSKMPLCVDPNDYALAVSLGNKDKFEVELSSFSVNLHPTNVKGLGWENVSNIRVIYNYVDSDDVINSCVAPKRGLNSSVYIGGKMDSIEISGTKNPILIEASSNINPVAMLGDVDLKVSFVEGLWWRLGGVPKPAVTVNTVKQFNEEEIRDYLKNQWSLQNRQK